MPEWMQRGVGANKEAEVLMNPSKDKKAAASRSIPSGVSPGAESNVLTLRDCSYGTVYGLARHGEIPGFKLGSDWRFLRSDIDTWIAKGGGRRKRIRIDPRGNRRKRPWPFGWYGLRPRLASHSCARTCSWAAPTTGCRHWALFHRCVGTRRGSRCNHVGRSAVWRRQAAMGTLRLSSLVVLFPPSVLSTPPAPRPRRTTGCLVTSGQFDDQR
jgi:excisionase family DNA binding protein